MNLKNKIVEAEKMLRTALVAEFFANFIEDKAAELWEKGMAIEEMATARLPADAMDILNTEVDDDGDGGDAEGGEETEVTWEEVLLFIREILPELQELVHQEKMRSMPDGDAIFQMLRPYMKEQEG